MCYSTIHWGHFDRGHFDQIPLYMHVATFLFNTLFVLFMSIISRCRFLNVKNQSLYIIILQYLKVKIKNMQKKKKPLVRNI